MDYRNKIHVDNIIQVKNPAKLKPFWQLGQVIELNLVGDEKNLLCCN